MVLPFACLRLLASPSLYKFSSLFFISLHIPTSARAETPTNHFFHTPLICVFLFFFAIKMSLLSDLVNLDLSDSTEKIIAEYIWSVFQFLFPLPVCVSLGVPFEVWTIFVVVVIWWRKLEMLPSCEWWFSCFWYVLCSYVMFVSREIIGVWEVGLFEFGKFDCLKFYLRFECALFIACENLVRFCTWSINLFSLGPRNIETFLFSICRSIMLRSSEIFLVLARFRWFCKSLQFIIFYGIFSNLNFLFLFPLFNFFDWL